MTRTVDTLPTMKELTKNFYRQSMIHHPDRNTGVKEKFQELLNAYHRVGDLIETSKDSTGEEDDEEKSARDLFRKYNFEKENMYTFTVFLENDSSFVWDEVLTDNYGQPIDRTKTNNGKQWTIQDFKCNNEENVSSKVFLTKYHMPKSDKGRTKILVQAEKCKQFLNISFVTNVLPILYREVNVRKHNVGGVEASLEDKKLQPKPTIAVSIPQETGCETSSSSASNSEQINDTNDPDSNASIQHEEKEIQEAPRSASELKRTQDWHKSIKL